MPLSSDSALKLRERFVGFAFAAADLLAEIGPDRLLTFTAGAFRERFGHEPEHFAGRPFCSLIAPEDHGGLEIALSLLAGRGRLTPVSVRLANAERTPVALSGLRLPNAAGVAWLTLARMPAALAETASLAGGAVFRDAVEAKLLAASPSRLGLVEVGGWSRLEPAQRRELEATIAEAMRNAGGEGALAADIADGRFGIVGNPDLDMIELQNHISRILRAAGAGRPVASTAIPLDVTDRGAAPNVIRAMRFALTCFAGSGVEAVRQAGFDTGLRGFLVRTEGRAGAVRTAIEDGRFRLVFQPVVSIASRAVHHFEALLRPFPIAGHEAASTQEFVCFAEAIGLAEPLDSAVLLRATEALRSSRARVAVNVSGISMQSPHFRETLLQTIEREPPVCRRLLVELTETADIEDVAAAADTIRRLGAAGVPVCLDDFGAGFAAFRYLQEFKVDFVKIDGSFVRQAHTGARESGFVGAMVDLARCVGASTIAETIETETQAKCMEELGVQLGQGWLFGKPGRLPGSL